MKRTGTYLVLLALCLLASHVHLADAMIFHFTDKTPICFVEEATAETEAITGSYAWAATQVTAAVKMSYTVFDPSGKAIAVPTSMDRGYHNIRVPLSHVHQAGRYLLCAAVLELPPKLNLVETPVQVEFMIDQAVKPLGEDDEAVLAVRKRVQGKEVFTYTDQGGQPKDILQPAKYLAEVTRGLRDIDKEFQRIKRGTDTYLERQKRMRTTTESTFTRVWLCAAFTITVIIIVVFVQFRMLKSTIKRKKLL